MKGFAPKLNVFTTVRKSLMRGPGVAGMGPMEKRAVQDFFTEERGRLHLTPEALENAYEYLRATLPFRRWNLPHADELVFRVMGARDRYGHFKGRFKDNVDLNEIG